ncbi:MAG TPA: hypothetical protein VFH49_03650, partial [Aquabacterium sp.]|nr:hypothetical protein [Aquabacterium sp.]
MQLQGLGHGAVQVYLPRGRDKLHLQGEWPIGAEVLEGTGVQGELQRRAGKLPHTFHLQPLLRIHSRCMHLG